MWLSFDWFGVEVAVVAALTVVVVVVAVVAAVAPAAAALILLALLALLAWRIVVVDEAGVTMDDCDAGTGVGPKR